MRAISLALLSVLIFFPVACPGLMAQDKDKDKNEQKISKEEEELNKLQREIQDSANQEALQARNKYYFGDEFLQAYVNDLGQSLVPKDAPADVYFSFRVINDVTPNAFALPDGRIFVHAGLLSFVDNEAQLAMVLGHEIGHVLERHAAKALKNSRSIKSGLFSGLAAAATGALTRDKNAADAAALMAASAIVSSYDRKNEDEADLVGIRLTLAKRIDPSQSVGFFEKLRDTFGEQDRLSNLLWGSNPRNVARIENIKKTLETEAKFKEEFNRLKNAGELSVDSGRFRLKASRLIRETAIQWIEEQDRYDIAKKNLERVEEIRSFDPKVLMYLGKVYKLIGRTEEDKNKALAYLQRALAADQRNLYPEIQRDLALMFAERTQGASTAQATELLKKYVLTYVETRGMYPPDLESIYDYLLLFGDGKWTAPRIERQMVTERQPAKPGI